MNNEIFTIEQKTDLYIVFLLVIFEFVLLISLVPSPCGFFGCCGEDYLFLRENTLRAFYISLVIVILQVIATLAYFRSGTGILGCALWFILLGNIFIPVNLWHDIPEREGYYETFDDQKFYSSLSVGVVRTIYKDKRLIGKTRSEVIEIFGLGREYPYGYYQNIYNTDQNVLSYPIYRKFSELIFIFKDDKVVHYILECDDYG